MSVYCEECGGSVHNRLCISCESKEREAENARLRAVLESIRDQTKCKAGKDDGNCWHDKYGRHSSECQWDISEEADDALKEHDNE